MKKILLIVLIVSAGIVYAKNKQLQNGYVLEHERDLKKTEAGPHNGGGTTNGYNYFDKIMFWKTPIAEGGKFVPYSRWTQDYIAIMGGR